MAAAAKLPATAAAEPPLDASGDFDGRCTFHTWPHASLDQWPNVAYSSNAVLPMITAPASRSLATWNASRAGRNPSNVKLPFVVGMSNVS